MLSPKELNFCKDVAADILRSSDNFSWIQEGKYYLNCSTVGNLSMSRSASGTIAARVPGSRSRLLVALKLNLGRLFPRTGFLRRPGRCIQERSGAWRICSVANGVTPTERAYGHVPLL